MTETSEGSGTIPDRSLILEEYKETLSYLRHDDQQAWTILGLSESAGKNRHGGSGESPPRGKA